MLFSLRARCGGGIFGLALVLVLLIAPACQLLPENPSRLLGERFMHSVAAQSDVPADFYLAPDAIVFLQGAPTPLSRAGFRDYVAVMGRGRREYQAGSRIFATPGGAGWILRISQLPDPAALYQSDAPELPPGLWMEASPAELESPRRLCRGGDETSSRRAARRFSANARPRDSAT